MISIYIPQRNSFRTYIVVGPCRALKVINTNKLTWEKLQPSVKTSPGLQVIASPRSVLREGVMISHLPILL